MPSIISSCDDEEIVIAIPQDRSLNRVVNNNNKSINSTILNSPSSNHRLQTLTRNQRTPLASNTRMMVTTTIKCSDNKVTSTVDRAATPISIGMMSNASSMLYLTSTTTIDDTSRHKHSSFNNVNIRSNDHAKQCRTKMGKRWLTSCGSHNSDFSDDDHYDQMKSCGRRTHHSVAYYLHMPRMDRFLSWVQQWAIYSFFILPIIWIMMAITWIVYLRKRNAVDYVRLMTVDSKSSSSNIFSERDELEDHDRTENELLKMWHVALFMTISAIIITIIFACIIVVKSNWAYSFEFIPNEDQINLDLSSNLSTTIDEPLMSDHNDDDKCNESKVNEIK